MPTRSAATPDVLPDLRNLGVLARILIAVNGAAFFAATVHAHSFAELVEQFLGIALAVEPALLAALVALWLLNPVLQRLPYWRGLALIAVTVVLVTLGVQRLLAMVDASAPEMLRGAAYALLATGLLAGYFHLRERAFSPALSEARLQALQARIRPHFLFNTINAVLSLIRKDARRAEAALEDLAELYRQVMADNKKLVTLEHELALTRQYLNLEQLRLGSRLRVDWRTEKAPMDALVPPLLLQPLVENAVYHGIEPGIEPGTIEIAIARLRDRVQFRLRNPYHVDHQHRQGNRIALANIRERLALHFDVEATLKTEVRGEVYEIRIDLPYKKAEELSQPLSFGPITLGPQR
ncbi:MAG: histidine kinase [Burkholderiales bacterium]|nr:histidine kinase [Burkholderiales bacterium]PZN05620.1 MAG: sensor histidine kinase [Pseudomonadota bacterium]